MAILVICMWSNCWEVPLVLSAQIGACDWYGVSDMLLLYQETVVLSVAMNKRYFG